VSNKYWEHCKRKEEIEAPRRNKMAAMTWPVLVSLRFGGFWECPGSPTGFFRECGAFSGLATSRILFNSRTSEQKYSLFSKKFAMDMANRMQVVSGLQHLHLPQKL
jgi:hypothetical protein